MTDIRLVSSSWPNAAIKSALMTDVRLVGAAWEGANEQIATGLTDGKESKSVSDVRLVAGSESAVRRTAPESPKDDMSDVRLVGNLRGPTQARTFDPGLSRLPALLVSYFYWKGFAQYRPRYAFRDYALDSGAYSAFTTGASIDLGIYIDFCLERLATDPQCTEVFSLDVIGDWKASLANTERMWAVGVPAIPVYHYGEPVSLLQQYASQSPKVALGGIVGMKGGAKLAWMEQCFARVYPCRIHGLGVANETALMRLPFHSTDATNWILGPAGFGGYKSMAKPTKAPRGTAINLRSEVEWWLRLERRLKQRWAGELAKLERDCPPWPIKRREPIPEGSPA